ncbi:MAG: hypothetical protein QXT25_02085 [Candidatus Anstonellaceae archaeon]
MPLCADPAFLYNVIFATAGLALATMISVLVISYMSASLFRKPEYEAFTSIEIYQLFVSAILFIGLFGATCFAAEMAEMFAGADPYEIGRDYLNDISQNVGLKVAVFFKAAELRYQYWGAWSMRWGPGAWGTILPAFPSAPVIEKVFSYLSIITMPFIASLLTQQIILEAIRGMLLPFLLPAAVLTRIFPPLRDASAFLIATAIGFGIIFPYTYVMHRYVVNFMLTNTFSTTSLPNIDDYMLSRYPNFTTETTEFGLYSYVKTFFYPFLSFSYLLLQALFLPALSITITIAFIKSFTKFIGQKLG